MPDFSAMAAAIWDLDNDFAIVFVSIVCCVVS
jgi:hypothetical protein